MGIVLPRDEAILYEALAYQPEGSTLHGFRPIDWANDKAAQYVTVSLSPTNTATALSLKDAYEGKQVEIAKLKLTKAPSPNAPLQNDISQTLYIGPVTPDYLEEFKKQAQGKAKVEELKSEYIPLDVYTNDAGAIAFVMKGVPGQPLLLPATPMMPIFSDPLEKIRALIAKPNQQEPTHRISDVTFAVLKS